jgi:hypothetical protein
MVVEGHVGPGIERGLVDKGAGPVKSRSVRIETLSHTLADLAARRGRRLKPRGAGDSPDNIVS